MSECENCYRSRPADDGGLYLLLPRDAHLLPLLPDTPLRVVIDWPEGQPQSEGDPQS